MFVKVGGLWRVLGNECFSPSPLFSFFSSISLACFNQLEDLCSRLQAMRDLLDRVWLEKGAKLDRILQLRIYENDSEQVMM